MRTPEEYFQETVELPVVPESSAGLTDAEQAFVEKYLGMKGSQALADVRSYEPAAKDSIPAFAGEAEEIPGTAGAEAENEPDFDAQLRALPEMQLVSFMVSRQEFAIPITSIQEVIRYVEPTKLPAAPRFLAGIINLRGRVTPLVSLRNILGIKGEADGDKFIIVCRHKGLQAGLIVSAVKTMYRAVQEQIEWGIESQLGVNAQYLAGLMKSERNLINILSVDRLISRVLAK